MAKQSPSMSKKPAVHRAVEDALDMSSIKQVDESPESHTVAAKEQVRDQIDDAVARFLAQGGKVQQIEPHVTAAPPKKPLSRYGDRPI
ncbi:hypothetical protein NO559_07030 [Dasania sp. GY-MA-18]|uniref:Transcriptional regulator SutA RNAP-binding domain-containing protein n=1 Tax=Dasania phycosphaerae TaxID=2950436 RepID=A0A9J6RKL3_9GAMM|nr:MULTISPECIES: hypothetical protein [Dasania]MCR8922520.1 hypothetical protein [Dasania sp. GY-MA-18]MCZ0864948.1 hypothetical protein [Dasania phycosphaerae]MCZ0868676.1 hypothetical protein [Dasania phycosphaerae]